MVGFDNAQSGGAEAEPSEYGSQPGEFLRKQTEQGEGKNGLRPFDEACRMEKGLGATRTVVGLATLGCQYRTAQERGRRADEGRQQQRRP